MPAQSQVTHRSSSNPIRFLDGWGRFVEQPGGFAAKGNELPWGKADATCPRLLAVATLHAALLLDSGSSSLLYVKHPDRGD